MANKDFIDMIPETDQSAALNILLIEDSIDDYVIFKKMLEDIYGETGFRLTWLTSPSRAIEVFFDNEFDIVLCDNFLGTGTGIDLIKSIRASIPTCPPILLLTSVNDERIDRSASEAGAFDFLVKQQLTGPQLERSIRFATQRKNFEEELIQVAHYDHLTGVANRTLFEFTLETTLKQSARNGKKLGLILLDLDHFKAVNDTHGHPIGDRLLREVTQRAAGSIRETDFLARLGGDEFCILASQLEDARHLAPVVAEIIASISEPYFFDGMRINIGATAGVSIYPTDIQDAEKLIEAADVALYKAKQNDKGGFCFYDEQLMTSIDWQNLSRHSATSVPSDHSRF